MKRLLEGRVLQTRSEWNWDNSDSQLCDLFFGMAQCGCSGLLSYSLFGNVHVQGADQKLESSMPEG